MIFLFFEKGGIKVNNVMEMANQVLLNVAVALIALAGAYATFYIKKATVKLETEAQKIKDDTQKELVVEALWRLDDVAEKTVNKIEQVTAKSIREAVKNGTKDKKELTLLAGDAYNEITTILEPEYVNLLKNTLGDFDTYLKNVIEDKVKKVKGAA